MSSERGSPTVLVARRVLPGAEIQFDEWMIRVAEAAQLAPGNIAVDVQRPDSTHPGEWMAVYQFEDAGSLEAWLESPERRELLDEGTPLIVGEAREQVFVSNPSDPGVRMVTSYLLKEGSEGEHREIHADILESLDGYPGFRDREILRPVPGVQPETVVILTFDDERSLHTWLDSDTREGLLARLDPHIEGTYTTNVLGGFAGWFSFDDSTEPRRWKQALVVLVALFPTSLLISFVRNMVWPNAPLVPAVLVANIIGVAALTWLLMPPLTRALSGWLSR